MFCSRAVAIKKLGLPSKIFDWVCFFNGVTTFCPRRKQKGEDSIYFSHKNIKQIESDPTLLKIKQLISWKKTNLKLRKNNKNTISNFPSYSFYQVIKKRFPNFKKALNLFQKILPFFLVEKKVAGNFFISPKFTKELDFLSSRCSYFTKNSGNLISLREKPEKIILNFFLLEKKKNFSIPIHKLKLKGSGKKFQLSVIGFYFNFMGLILSKLFKFQNFLFLNTEYYFLEEVSLASFNCPIRFYIKPIQGSLLKSSFSSRPKNLSLYKEFNSKNFRNEDQIFKNWIFSKNFLFPPFFGIDRNFVFFSENSQKIESLNSIIKGNKVPLKNNKNITYGFSQKNSYDFSLIGQFVNLSWFLGSLTVKNILPTNPYIDLNISKKVLKNFSKKKILQPKISAKKKERFLISGQIFLIFEKRFSDFSIISLKKGLNSEKMNVVKHVLFSLIKTQKD